MKEGTIIASMLPGSAKAFLAGEALPAGQNIDIPETAMAAHPSNSARTSFSAEVSQGFGGFDPSYVLGGPYVPIMPDYRKPVVKKAVPAPWQTAAASAAPPASMRMAGPPSAPAQPAPPPRPKVYHPPPRAVDPAVRPSLLKVEPTRAQATAGPITSSSGLSSSTFVAGAMRVPLTSAPSKPSFTGGGIKKVIGVPGGSVMYPSNRGLVAPTAAAVPKPLGMRPTQPSTVVTPAGVVVTWPTSSGISTASAALVESASVSAPTAANPPTFAVESRAVVKPAAPLAAVTTVPSTAGNDVYLVHVGPASPKVLPKQGDAPPKPAGVNPSQPAPPQSLSALTAPMTVPAMPRPRATFSAVSASFQPKAAPTFTQATVTPSSTTLSSIVRLPTAATAVVHVPPAASIDNPSLLLETSAVMPEA